MKCWFHIRILAWVYVSVDQVKVLPMDLSQRYVEEGALKEAIRDLGGPDFVCVVYIHVRK